MRRDDILRLMRRIVHDFAPLLPGIRLEVVPPEGFRARLRGKPVLPETGTGGAAAGEEELQGGEAARLVLPGEGSFNEKATGETGPDVGAPGKAGAGEPGEALSGDMTRGEVATPIPLLSVPANKTIFIEMNSLYDLVSREDRRLHRPLVEGMILREVIYLATSRQPFPDPRARAEAILRRHWPFQYAALRSVGLTMTGFGHPASGPELAKDN